VPPTPNASSASHPSRQRRSPRALSDRIDVHKALAVIHHGEAVGPGRHYRLYQQLYQRLSRARQVGDVDEKTHQGALQLRRAHVERLARSLRMHEAAKLIAELTERTITANGVAAAVRRGVIPCRWVGGERVI
jgi:hypothetical protein